MSDGYRLTPRALADLDAIADFTIEKWGIEQLETYLGTLLERLVCLAENPLLGRDRNEIQPGYRSIPVGSHVVFYVIDGDFINIIGIPHKSMDIGALLF